MEHPGRRHAVRLDGRRLGLVPYARHDAGVTPEALRDAYRRFYAGQADAHAELMAPDVVAVDRSGALDAGTHRGLREYVAWAQDFLDLFSEVHLDDMRLEELPGDRLLALLDLRVVTHSGGMPVSLTIGHLLQLRDGAIAELDAFIDEQVARDFACA